MSGLRETIRRRGGLALTSRVVGGLWVVGERTQTSPYNAAATAALMAAFTAAQWATIRDYGFAHPEIVGYMNAYATEDAKIAYSLVEGIGTRWLVGNGSAYCKVGLLASDEFTMKTKVKVVNSYSGEKDFFGNIGSSRQFCIGYWAQGWFFYNTQTNSTVALGEQGIKEIEAEYSLTNSTKKLTVNGVSNTQSISVTIQNTSQLCIMAGGVGYNIWRDLMAYFEYNDGTAHKYVPFIRNNAMELLDLVSGNLATRVGTFTELIESPS